MTAPDRPGMNDVLPCPSDSARRRHAAHGQVCPTCDPEVERSATCPDCRSRVTVRGVLYERHDVEGTGVECRRSGRLAVLPWGRAA